MGILGNFLTFVYVILCVFLIFVILIQSGKGGGLSSLGASSAGISDAFGTTGGERFLNKVTTVCAVLFLVFAITISFLVGHEVRQREEILTDQPTGAPVVPGQPATLPDEDETIPMAPQPEGLAPEPGETIPMAPQAPPPED